MPADWEAYLIDERQLRRSAAPVSVPLCPDCQDDAAALKDAHRELRHYAESKREDVRTLIWEFLDEIDLTRVESV
jgi:hypothetical protein